MVVFDEVQAWISAGFMKNVPWPRVQQVISTLVVQYSLEVIETAPKPSQPDGQDSGGGFALKGTWEAIQYAYLMLRSLDLQDEQQQQNLPMFHNMVWNYAMRQKDQTMVQGTAPSTSADVGRDTTGAAYTGADTTQAGGYTDAYYHRATFPNLADTRPAAVKAAEETVVEREQIPPAAAVVATEVALQQQQQHVAANFQEDPFKTPTEPKKMLKTKAEKKTVAGLDIKGPVVGVDVKNMDFPVSEDISDDDDDDDDDDVDDDVDDDDPGDDDYSDGGYSAPPSPPEVKQEEPEAETQQLEMECETVRGAARRKRKCTQRIRYNQSEAEEEDDEEKAPVQPVLQVKIKKAPKSRITRSSAVPKKKKPKKKRKRERKFPCKLCSHITCRKDDLYLHMTRRHGAKEMKCDQCDSKFANEYDLKRHVKVKHDTHHICDICQEELNTPWQLKNHILTHDDDKVQAIWKKFIGRYPFLVNKFLCETCGKGFSQRAHLLEHENQHRGEKPYLCSECGKSYAHSSTLRWHKRLQHAGENAKKFQCMICNREFGSHRYLKKHLAVHDPNRQKEYMCSVCTSSFTSMHALKRHERAHQGERPYQCLICLNRFNCSSVLYRHLRLRHKIEKPGSLSSAKVGQDVENLSGELKEIVVKCRTEEQERPGVSPRPYRRPKARISTVRAPTTMDNNGGNSIPDPIHSTPHPTPPPQMPPQQQVPPPPVMPADYSAPPQQQQQPAHHHMPHPAHAAHAAHAAHVAHAAHAAHSAHTVHTTHAPTGNIRHSDMLHSVPTSDYVPNMPHDGNMFLLPNMASNNYTNTFAAGYFSYNN